MAQSFFDFCGASQIAPNGPNYFGNREGIIRGFREGLTKALDEFKPDELAANLSHGEQRNL